MADETNTTNSADVQIPDELQNEVKMRFELLPPDVQKVIADSDYAKTLFEVAKSSKLTYPQLETLQLETFMALLGMNKPEEYRSFLQNEFKKSNAEMDVMISAINEKIFDPIKESMKQVYGENDALVSGDLITPSGIEPENNYFADSLNSTSESTPEPVPVSTVIPIRTIPTPVAPAAAPAASTSMPMAGLASGLTATERNVLGNAGVVLGESQNTAGTSQSESKIPDRSELMKSIENPAKSPTSTIMANKLSTSATLMPNKTTDYSLPKTSQPVATVPATSAPAQMSGADDPYHEKI